MVRGGSRGLPGAPEETGPPLIVYPRRRNPETAFFGLDRGSYGMRQCFSQVGEDCRPAKGRLGGMRDGEGLLGIEVLFVMEVMIGPKYFAE